MQMSGQLPEALESENMTARKYVEVKLKRGRRISQQMQQDLLRFYGFKIITRGKVKEEN